MYVDACSLSLSQCSNTAINDRCSTYNNAATQHCKDMLCSQCIIWYQKLEVMIWLLVRIQIQKLCVYIQCIHPSYLSKGVSYLAI